MSPYRKYIDIILVIIWYIGIYETNKISLTIFVLVTRYLIHEKDMQYPEINIPWCCTINWYYIDYHKIAIHCSSRLPFNVKFEGSSILRKQGPYKNIRRFFVMVNKRSNTGLVRYSYIPFNCINLNATKKTKTIYVDGKFHWI